MRQWSLQNWGVLWAHHLLQVNHSIFLGDNLGSSCVCSVHQNRLQKSSCDLETLSDGWERLCAISPSEALFPCEDAPAVLPVQGRWAHACDWNKECAGVHSCPDSSFLVPLISAVRGSPFFQPNTQRPLRLYMPGEGQHFNLPFPQGFISPLFQSRPLKST